jgi:hypothetical protein
MSTHNYQYDLKESCILSNTCVYSIHWLFIVSFCFGAVANNVFTVRMWATVVAPE